MTESWQEFQAGLYNQSEINVQVGACEGCGVKRNKIMKKYIVIAMLALGLPGLADARLGDTLAEASARYGPVVQEGNNNGMPSFVFDMDGLVIMALFDPDMRTCITMIYQKKWGWVINQKEREFLLGLNGQGWKSVPKAELNLHYTGKGEGGRLSAIYIASEHLLIVAPKDVVGLFESGRP